MARVEGGPRGLIEAFLAALGPHGTLAMPSMSDDDDHPFDPRKTDCRGMGIVADTFWRLPGVLCNTTMARSPTAAKTSISWIDGWRRKGSCVAALSDMRRRV
jgi:aminoglycoside N3'-acetyltransferase